MGQVTQAELLQLSQFIDEAAPLGDTDGQVKKEATDPSTGNRRNRLAEVCRRVRAMTPSGLLQALNINDGDLQQYLEVALTHAEEVQGRHAGHHSFGKTEAMFRSEVEKLLADRNLLSHVDRSNLEQVHPDGLDDFSFDRIFPKTVDMLVGLDIVQARLQVIKVLSDERVMGGFLQLME